MKLLFVGDSYTIGRELSNPEHSRFSKLICNHYDAEEINLAVGGCGNDQIFLNATKYLENNNPDCCILQLSDIARITLASDVKDRYRTLNPNANNNTLQTYVAKYLFAKSSKNLETWYQLTRYKLILFENYLKAKNIKYVFCVKGKFDEFNYFKTDDTLPKSMKNNFIWESLTNISKDHKAPNGHPNEYGHELIANILIKKLDKILIT